VKALPIGTRIAGDDPGFHCGGWVRRGSGATEARHVGSPLIGAIRARACSPSLTDDRKEASKRLRFLPDPRELAFQCSILSGEV
jgi:hypothetical protein